MTDIDTHADTPAAALTARERAVVDAITLLHGGLATAVARALATAGVSPPDHDVLAQLADRPGRRCRAGELRRALGWDKSRLSHHLDRMERRGLVVREPCQRDLRSGIVAMTTQGRDALAAATPARAAAVRAHLATRVTPAQADALLGLAGTLRDRADVAAQ